MTPAEVAQRLVAPRRVLAVCSKGIDYEEIAGGFLVTAPWYVTPFPSTNPNRAEFLGVARPAQRRDLETAVARFAAAGVARWFFRLSPCVQSAELRAWLRELGLRPFHGPRYMVLARPAAELPPHPTELRVRALPAAELQDHRMLLMELYYEYTGLFLATSARGDCTPYLAFDGDRPVAGGALCVSGDTGYLFLGATREADRRRGAQNALIAERVTAAWRQGCRVVLVETMDTLAASLANLLRQGFRESFATEVFVHEDAPADE